MNLREAVHMVELRTMPQGHPDYRFICQEMWRKIQEVHPTLAEAGKFVDWQKYRLGRCNPRCGRSLRSQGLRNEARGTSGCIEEYGSDRLDRRQNSRLNQEEKFGPNNLC